MSTTELPPGIYRIVVANAVEPTRLTRDGENVTILPPGVGPEKDQEWQITKDEDGNIAIERPSAIFPTSSLTYRGSSTEPKRGDRVVDRVSEFPLHQWQFDIAPGFRSFIRVVNSDLGIQIAPQKIFPPFLELGDRDLLQWVFERVRDE